MGAASGAAAAPDAALTAHGHAATGGAVATDAASPAERTGAVQPPCGSADSAGPARAAVADGGRPADRIAGATFAAGPGDGAVADQPGVAACPARAAD
ncbi:hypothetical protein BST12_26400, partial [Mycobacterium angelicum]